MPKARDPQGVLPIPSPLDRAARKRAAAVPVQTELEEMKTLARWLDLRRVLWCHVPNEGKRSMWAAMSQKRQGLKAGVPDVLIFSRPSVRAVPAFRYRGVAVELKRRTGGTTSPTQKEWCAALESQGWAVHVALGSFDAITWLQGMGY